MIEFTLWWHNPGDSIAFVDTLRGGGLLYSRTQHCPVKLTLCITLNVTQARRDDVHVKWVTGLILALSLCILQLQVQMAEVLMPGPGQALPRRAWSKQLPLRRKPDLVPFSRQLPLTQLKVSLYLGVFHPMCVFVCVCVCCVCRGVGITFHGGAAWRIHHDHHRSGTFILQHQLSWWLQHVLLPFIHAVL